MFAKQFHIKIFSRLLFLDLIVLHVIYFSFKIKILDANGLFLYDIYLPDNYPTQCPKMQLMTTGGNSIRFNPNLYSNGYVCLSLLGTWRGDSTESWNPEKSNLL